MEAPGKPNTIGRGDGPLPWANLICRLQLHFLFSIWTLLVQDVFDNRVQCLKYAVEGFVRQRVHTKILAQGVLVGGVCVALPQWMPPPTDRLVTCRLLPSTSPSLRCTSRSVHPLHLNGCSAHSLHCAPWLVPEFLHSLVYCSCAKVFKLLYLSWE